AYAVHGRTVAFHLGAYDHVRPLVIDPSVLVYGTLIGGTGDDFAHEISVGADGSAYIAGDSNSPTFPTGVTRYHPGKCQSGTDAFNVKPKAAGTQYAYQTFLGGTNGDTTAFGIDLNSSGDVVVSGDTTAGNLTTLNTFAGGAPFIGIDPTGAGTN